MEDRPDDPPVEADDLLRQAMDSVALSADASAAAPNGTEEDEASEDEDEIRLLRDHFRGTSA